VGGSGVSGGPASINVAFNDDSSTTIGQSEKMWKLTQIHGGGIEILGDVTTAYGNNG